MCGIAGVFELHGGGGTQAAPLDLLGRMAAVLHHRGPDDTGIAQRGQAALAFARLSIIDVAGGHQPMTYAGDRYAIVFNGEIYNFRALRHQLEAEGATFTTRSDTEVVLALYERHGSGLLAHINGMFAFAIHDRQEGSLLLARDRLGVKPLYYALDDRRAVFGSEIKAILCDPEVDDEVDPAAVGDYLTYGFVPAPRTIYRAVRALPPAHCLTLRDGRARMERYWSVRRRPDAPRTLPEAVAALGELLDDATRIRLESEVPLGVLLSGGIDSGLVTAFMARHCAEAVRTFSVGFEEESHDELPWARRVAEKYGTRHTEIVCRPQIADLVPRIAAAFDQPFGDSSAVPTWSVCETARRYVTVALAGDGGDEVFAGYQRHTLFQRRALQADGASVAGALARGVSRAIAPTLPGAQRLRRLGLSDAEFQVDCLVLAEDRLKRRLAGERVRRDAEAFDSVRLGMGAGGEFEAEGGVLRFQHQDLTLYLPNDVLEKVDKMSMQHSLEVRGPLLDYRIVELGLNLPAALKNDGVHGKLLLRELGRQLLPPGHLDRPKTGFGIPTEQWLRGPLRELLRDTLEASTAAEAGWLDGAYTRRLLKLHMGGRDYSPLLWSLMMFELWHRSAQVRAATSGARRA
jgi:asparagine synthase (glutamine-hydrolysing)